MQIARSALFPRARSIIFPQLNFHTSRTRLADPISTEPLPDASPSANAAGDLSDPLKAAQDEVQKLRMQLADSHSGRLRLLADMENVRMIARRDVDQGKVYALQSFSKRLLDVVDNLQRAVESVPADMRQKGAARADTEKVEAVLNNLFVGVDATHRDFVKLMGQQGIESFGTAGEKFDANRHEAMIEVPASSSAPAGTVASVFKSGWILKDRVLRAAQVSVAVKQS